MNLQALLNKHAADGLNFEPSVESDFPNVLTEEGRATIRAVVAQAVRRGWIKYPSMGWRAALEWASERIVEFAGRPPNKVTIDQLENILKGEKGKITIQPDGSVIVDSLLLKAANLIKP